MTSFSSPLVYLVYFAMLFSIASAQLNPYFYEHSCPRALKIIQKAVINATRNEPRMAASLLRLHFHDCFVNGCDASVLLDDTANFTGEKTAFPNAGSLRGFDVIDSIKSQLEALCPKVVSCADIVAVAARDSVVALSGPTWPVGLGRRDSTTANITAANSDLPSPASNLTTLISAFSKKGFIAQEMVTLSGAHTIGKARCVVFRSRIYNDTNINSRYAKSLQKSCPVEGGNDNLADLDETTNVFDNTYYKDLVALKGLLHSDQVLYNGGSTDFQVVSYNSNNKGFFHDFAKAMIKMGNISPLTGSAGQIRSNCRKINGA